MWQVEGLSWGPGAPGPVYDAPFMQVCKSLRRAARQAVRPGRTHASQHVSPTAARDLAVTIQPGLFCRCHVVAAFFLPASERRLNPPEGLLQRRNKAKVLCIGTRRLL